jgi:hypothetical protein
MTIREREIYAMAEALYEMQRTLWVARGMGLGEPFDCLEAGKIEDWKLKANRLMERFVILDREALVMYHSRTLEGTSAEIAIAEEVDRLAKESTAPDRETPNWMRADIRRGIVAGLRLSAIFKEEKPGRYPEAETGDGLVERLCEIWNENVKRGHGEITALREAYELGRIRASKEGKP